MIIDAFLGFNEFDLARFRIRYLRDYVETTYILEGNLTHSGESKGYWFSDLPQDFWGGADVRIIRIELDTEASSLNRERESRRKLVEALAKNNRADLFIMSDLDEIPSTAQIDFLLENTGLYHFDSPTFIRYANWRSLSAKNKKWSRGVMGEIQCLRDEQGHRFSSLPKVAALEPGGHFSYMQTSKESIKLKLDSFYHTEFKESLNGETKTLEFCDAYGISHLGHFDDGSFGLLEIVDESNLSEIQAQLYSLHPQYFNFNLVQHKTFVRIFASLVLSACTHFDSSKTSVFDEFISKSSRSKLFWFRITSIILRYLALVSLPRIVKSVVSQR